MSSEIKADKWSPASGTSATIGDSGDTYTVPSGVTLDTSSSTLTLPSSVISGQTAITSLADTDKFLVSDASDSGNLKYVEKQYLPSGTLVKTGSVDFESGTGANNVYLSDVFTDTYDTYLVVLRRILPEDDGDAFRFRFTSTGTTEISGGNYDYASRYFDQDGSSSSNTGNNQTRFQIADSISNQQADGGADFHMWITLDRTDTSGNTGGFDGTGHFADGSGINHSAYIGGYYQESTANAKPGGLQFLCASGQIRKIHAIVYGVTE